MRGNWLSNRIFQTCDDILAHCCEAWNKLTDQPWRIMSIGLREWAHGCGSMSIGMRCVLAGQMAFQTSADLQKRATGWLPKGCNPLTVVPRHDIHELGFHLRNVG